MMDGIHPCDIPFHPLLFDYLRFCFYFSKKVIVLMHIYSMIEMVRCS